MSNSAPFTMSSTRMISSRAIKKGFSKVVSLPNKVGKGITKSRSAVQRNFRRLLYFGEKKKSSGFAIDPTERVEETSRESSLHGRELNDQGAKEWIQGLIQKQKERKVDRENFIEQYKSRANQFSKGPASCENKRTYRAY
jgi:hypothetical protein